MLAVGNFSGPGFKSQINSSLVVMQNSWDVRMGTASQHAVWKDELKDVLARLGLRFGDINEKPPEKPEGLALTRESYGLWLDAVEQYQIEGTALFDAVRPSLPLTGAYTQMDVRAISQMKSETSAVKDGRALLRWALDFVNQSSLSCQMQLLERELALTLTVYH